MTKAAEFRAGWRDLAAATLGLGFGIPGYTAISSLFFQAVASDFHWSSTAVAGSLVALPLTAMALPLAGRLVDRLGVRAVSGASAVCLALSFLWLSRLHGSLAEYYGAILALNVLGCATGPVAYTRLIAARFAAARGSALAVAQFGIALVAAVAPPALTAVFVHVGWRGAYEGLALAVLIGGGVSQLLMRTRGRRAPVDEPGSGIAVRAALRSRGFWVLAAAILCTSAASLGLVTQFQPVLVTRGIGLQKGGWLLSLLALAVMLSRLAVGRLLDFVYPERWAAATMIVAASGAVVLLAAGTAMPLLAAGILLFGVSIGAELDLMGFFCARLFGCRHYSALYGLLSIGFYLGMALGGVGYGVVRDATGGYASALAGSAALFAASAVLFLLLATIAPMAALAAEQPEKTSR